MRDFKARNLAVLLVAGIAVAGFVAACGSSNNPSTTSSSDASSVSASSGGVGGATVAASSSASGEGGFDLTTSSSTGSGGPACDQGSPSNDDDKDGFTEQQGDCNDCDPNVNPGAVEVVAKADSDGGVPKAVDEDCDGKVDNVMPSCDDGLMEGSLDAMDGAKAIGLCDARFLMSAKWVQADGSPPPVGGTQLMNFHLGHGIVDAIGPNLVAQEGQTMLDLSSGTARKPSSPGYKHRNFDKGYTGNAPVGFPKESPSCPGAVTGAVHDATGLEVELKAPTNAKALTFDFNFFTFEWPDYICKQFNDFFIANMTPFPNMQMDGNISFDPNGNPVSVNNGFLSNCGCPASPANCVVPPNNPMTPFACSFGPNGLGGTDWATDDNHAGWTNGSTGWLQTSAPVTPGQSFTIRFVTYDSADGNVDSSTFVDRWRWLADAGKVETVVQPPK